MEENIKKGNNLLIIFLIVILGLSIAYICYLKGYFNNTYKTENTSSNILSSDEINKLGENLYYKTSTDYLYTNELVTYDSIKNADKLNIAYEMIPNKFITNYVISTSDFDENGNATKYSKQVSTNIFNLTYFNIFGEDKKITYEEFVPDNLLETCRFETDNLRCYQQSEGGDVMEYLIYRKYAGAKENEDGSIVVNVNYLKYDFAKGIYSDPKETNKIDAGDSLKNIDYTTINDEIMFNKYGSKAGLFNVTFKKDTLGNYYWVSSEFVK